MRVNLRMQLVVLNHMPMHVHGIESLVSGSTPGGCQPTDVPRRARRSVRDGEPRIASGDRTMQDIHNGISAAELVGASWKKSQRSNSQGGCVEIARLDSDPVPMRNPRAPRGTALVYPAGAVRSLVSAMRAGEFDYLVN